MGNYQNLVVLVQKPVRATPFRSIFSKKSRGQKIKSKTFFFWKNVFFNAYIILEENQILNKTSFLHFFLFLKRVLFPKIGFAQLSLLKIFFWSFTLESSSALMCLILKVLSFHLKCLN